MRRLALAIAGLLACTGDAFACAAAPSPVRDLDVTRFYADAAGSKVDPSLQAKHDAAVAPLTAFLRQVTQDADKAWTRPTAKSQGEAAACALVWLTAWAHGGAWLGRMESQQAEYQRKWDLAGAALGYLKVRRFATAEQRTIIEPWLRQWADAARRFFDEPARSRNNHWYWLGLGLAAVGIGTDSTRHWEMARSIMRDAASDIGADGRLDKELTRGARAGFYHVFAVVPLVMMAELAAARGEDWYGAADGALDRLVSLCHRGLQDASVFQGLAGIAQEARTNARAGWLPLYLDRFPDRLASPHPHVAEGHRWLGGNVRVLATALHSFQ